MRNCSLQDVVQECYNICDKLSIPYSQNIAEIKWNGRLRTCWGRCSRYQDGHFEIHLNRRLEQSDVKNKKVKSVLLHEILHTCPGCYNHGKIWSKYAKTIKKATGIKINAMASAEQIGAERNYKVKCRNCKVSLYYAIKPVNKEKNRCPICGSKKLTCFLYTDDKKEMVWKRKD